MESTDEDLERRNERTNQVGLFNYAESYIVAAIALVRAKPRMLRFDAPIESLLFHAIELYLKSFLGGAGLDISVLEGRKFGHNLRKLISESRKQGFKLLPIDTKRLELIQDHDLAIRARYIKTGLMQRINLDDLVETARNVRDAAKVTFPISRSDGSEPVPIIAISNELEAFIRNRSSARRD